MKIRSEFHFFQRETALSSLARNCDDSSRFKIKSGLIDFAPWESRSKERGGSALRF